MEDLIFGVHARCCICDEYVDDRYKRGNKYYCAEDFQKTSTEEILGNKENKQIKEEVERITHSPEEME